MVVPASPQDHGRSEGSGHRQSDQGEQGPGLRLQPPHSGGQVQIDHIGDKVTDQKGRSHPPQRGGAPVPDQQAEHAVIAEVEHAAGILHPQRLPRRHPCRQVQCQPHYHHAQSGDQPSVRAVALPHHGHQQGRVEDGGGGDPEALRPHCQIQLGGQGHCQPDQQPALPRADPPAFSPQSPHGALPPFFLYFTPSPGSYASVPLPLPAKFHPFLKKSAPAPAPSIDFPPGIGYDSLYVIRRPSAERKF